MINSFLEATLTASLEIYKYIHSVSDESAFLAHSEGAGGDTSIGFDIKAENIYIEYLQDFGEIHSEECGVYKEKSSDYRVVIDPIDGSDNIKSHFPYYGSSVALQHNGETIAGVVCNFATSECFVRSEYEHYKCSLFEPRVKKNIIKNEHSSVGIFEKSLNNPEVVEMLKDLRLKFRTPGAVALSLAHAHYVNYVLFLGTIRFYDVEAGLYLCKDLNIYVDHNIILVSKNEKIFNKIKDKLALT